MAQINKLSSKTIEATKTETEKWLGDGGGLYLRVRPDGKVWAYWYTSPTRGKRRKHFFGSYPAVTLAAAREKAVGLRQLVAEGKDPMEQVAQQKQVAKHGQAPRTIAELLERWADDYLKTAHEDEGAYARRSIELHALPFIGEITLEGLRASHVVEVLSKLRAAGKLRTAAVVLANLRQMIAHAIECDWIPGDPTAAIKKTKWAGKSVSRDRVLSEEEIKLLANQLYQADLAPQLIHCIWLILATGTRVEETALAEFKHVDFDQRTWLIPAQNQKKTNRATAPEDFLIFLSPFALSQIKRLRSLPQEASNQEWARQPADKRPTIPPVVPDPIYLFPAAKRDGAMNEKTLTHAVKDRQKFGAPAHKGRTKLVDALQLPGGPWTPHDLRRTAATLMQSMKVRPDIIDKCLNHVEDDKIRQTYQRAEMQAEMQSAWLRLGEKLEQLIRETEDI